MRTSVVWVYLARRSDEVLSADISLNGTENAYRFYSIPDGLKYILKRFISLDTRTVVIQNGKNAVDFFLGLDWIVCERPFIKLCGLNMSYPLYHCDVDETYDRQNKISKSFIRWLEIRYSVGEGAYPI